MHENCQVFLADNFGGRKRFFTVQQKNDVPWAESKIDIGDAILCKACNRWNEELICANAYRNMAELFEVMEADLGQLDLRWSEGGEIPLETQQHILSLQHR